MNTKQKIEIENIISDLKQLFEIGDIKIDNASAFNNNEFMIDKRKYERMQVLGMLQDYFSDKVIIGGYLEVDPITFVFTTFEVKQGIPNHNHN